MSTTVTTTTTNNVNDGDGGEDIESGMVQLQMVRPLPKVAKCLPNERTEFLENVFVLLSLQLLLALFVSLTIMLVDPLSHFFLHTTTGFVLFIISFLLPFPLIWPFYVYRKHHFINWLLLKISALSFALATGVICALDEGLVVLMAVMLTSVFVISFTAYIIWASIRGNDCNFLRPFFGCAVAVLLVFSPIQFSAPDLEIWPNTLGCLSAMLFSACIIYNTNQIIKYCHVDEYIWVAGSLHLAAIITLFSYISSRTSRVAPTPRIDL